MKISVSHQVPKFAMTTFQNRYPREYHLDESGILIRRATTRGSGRLRFERVVGRGSGFGVNAA